MHIWPLVTAVETSIGERNRRMYRLTLMVCTTVILALVCSGCGHTQTCRVGLISFGNLEGKIIPDNVEGPIVEGSTAAKPKDVVYYLSDAARDALKSGEYDTLVDAEVTTETGFLVKSNKIVVRGKALNSQHLKQSGGER